MIPFLSRGVSEHFRDEVHNKAPYKFMLLHFTFYFEWQL